MVVFAMLIIQCLPLALMGEMIPGGYTLNQVFLKLVMVLFLFLLYMSYSLKRC